MVDETMNTRLSLNGKEVYVVDLASEQAGGGGLLLYAPLSGIMLPLMPEDYCSCSNTIKNKPEYRQVLDAPQTHKIDLFCNQQADSVVRMSLIPTFACNFSCSYCYSAGGRLVKKLNTEHMQRAFRYFFSASRSSRNDRYVSIVGGGEPLLVWDSVTREAISQIRKLEQENGLEVSLGITTNGSLITEEIADFLAQHQVRVSISFEILKDIQNLHRKHYELVSRNIHLLHEKGITPQFRVTVTPHNVKRLKETVQECAHTFPFIRSINMEYVIADSFFSNAQELETFFQDFAKSFFEALQSGQENNIRVNTSVYQNLRVLSDRFCSGDFCLTPDGLVSGCHRFTSSNEKHFSDAVYAEVNREEIRIDSAKFAALMNYNVHRQEKCRQCPVKWHCGGTCLSIAFNYNDEYQEVICRFKRQFLALHLSRLRAASAPRNES